MQEHPSSGNILPKASRSPFILSVVFFVVILATLGVGIWQNSVLKGSIETSRQGIEQKKQEILSLNKDKEIIITKIVKSGTIRPSIDLQGIVRDFYDAASRANVRLSGFTLANDILSTELISTEPDGIIHPDSASTIIKMMREYESGRGGRFILDPIESIVGTPDKRTTAIQFRVLPSTIQ